MPQRGSTFSLLYDWFYPHLRRDLVDSFCTQLSISRPVAEILTRRRFHSVQSAREFLNPKLDHLNDPYLMPDMDRAVDLISRAMQDRQPIVIYGHDDIDGITSALVLRDAIRMCHGIVETYIPDRIAEGTGLNRKNLDHLLLQGAKLIVTVDCNIEERGLAEDVRDIPLDIIVTDHHEVHSTLSREIPFVNPKRPLRRYPFRELSGVGVSFKVAQALLQSKNQPVEKYFQQVADLIALGVIADRVPLNGENRVFSKVGFERMKRSPRPGLQAILDVVNEAQYIHQGFLMRHIIPVLNSSPSRDGRNDALLLLESTDKKRSSQWVRELIRFKEQWQMSVEESFQRVLRTVEREESTKERMIIALNDQVPPQTLGACVSKLTRLYHKPSCVLGFSGDRYVGEARAPRGWNLVDMFHQCQDLLISYGGHKQAAGFSIFPEDVPDFLERLTSISDDFQQVSQPFRRLDAELDIQNLSASLFQDMDRLGPFGRGNPSPTFLSRRVSMSPVQNKGVENRDEPVASINGIDVIDPQGILNSDRIVLPTSQKQYDIVYQIYTSDNHDPQIILRDLGSTGRSK